MAHLPFAAFDDPAAWTATGPDGSPSGLVTATAVPGHLPGVTGLRVAAGARAAGHRVEVALGPLDLRPFADLQVWVRSDRAATPEGGFLLELAAGAGNLGVDAPSNRWRRMLAVADAGRWQPVVVAIDGLASQVRSGLRGLRLTVVSDEPFAMDLSALAALRQELVADVERALVARLDGQLELGGDPVPAVVAPDAPPGPAGRPHLRIRPVALTPAPERSRSVELRTDYTATGFSLRPPPEPVDLAYAVDAVAGDRASERALVELIVDRLPVRGTLVVNDRPLPLEWRGGVAQAGDPPVPSAALVVATARSSTAPPQPAVPPLNEIRVEVDDRAPA